MRVEKKKKNHTGIRFRSQLTPQRILKKKNKTKKGEKKIWRHVEL